MKVTLDGSRIHDLGSFTRELATAVRARTGESDAYFGSTLAALHDCLFGGLGGQPPYEIEVENAEAMVVAMDDVGAVDYRAEELRRIDPAEVHSAERRTPLDELFEFIETAPTELILRSASGAVIRRSRPLVARPRLSRRPG